VDTAIRRQTLADLLRRSAKRFPHKTAIECVVFAESLPKNPSGKLLKRELRQKYQARFRETA
jgi:fatty-acyl-CoA synthase